MGTKIFYFLFLHRTSLLASFVIHGGQLLSPLDLGEDIAKVSVSLNTDHVPLYDVLLMNDHFAAVAPKLIFETFILHTSGRGRTWSCVV